MRNFLLGALITALTAGIIYRIALPTTSSKTTIESTNLILERLQNVSKLVVTEGHFSEIITYDDAKKMYLDLFTAHKKAIVVVNAKVLISYDMQQIKHSVDPDTKTVTITHIPEAEVTIHPTIKYHHLEEDFFNPFTPNDHNQIQQKITQQLNKKIAVSSLSINAQNRLISELQKIYILTQAMGWKLVYKNQVVQHLDSITVQKPSL